MATLSRSLLSLKIDYKRHRWHSYSYNSGIERHIGHNTRTHTLIEIDRERERERERVAERHDRETDTEKRMEVMNY